jgi:transcriptional regulator with XRE-family HTH domain
MEFKDWLRENRKQKGMTLIDLQNRTELSNAQLSRLETGKSELTLFSAVRILHALDLSWSTLYTDGIIDGDIKSMLSYRDMETKPSKPQCVNFNDVDALADSGLIQSGKASKVIVSLIERFLQKFDVQLNKREFENLAVSLYSYIGDPNVTSKGLPAVLKKVSFSYPSELDPTKLREIYLAGGVLIMQDLSFYIKELRRIRKLSLRKQAKAIDITHQALTALETRMNEKVKLMDIVNLDKNLELNGELVLFSWRAAELYMGTSKITSKRKRIAQPRSAVEIQVIEKLVVLSRLFLYYFPDDFEWLKWFREKSLSGYKNFK